MADALPASPPCQPLTEIERMFFACRDPMTSATVDCLVNRIGIPPLLVTTFAIVGVGRVREDCDYVDLDPSGAQRLIIAVRGNGDDVPFDPEPHSASLTGEVVDLISTSTKAPLDYQTHYGVPLLGHLPLGGAPVPLWPHPLAWARAGGYGVCILDRDRIARMTLMIAMRGAIYIPAPRIVTRKLEEAA